MADYTLLLFARRWVENIGALSAMGYRLSTMIVFEALTNSECHFVTMKKEIIMWNQQKKDINSFMS